MLKTNSRICCVFKLRILAALGLILNSLNLQAGTVEKSHVERSKDHFILHLEMLIAAPLEQVRTVLLDFENIDTLNDSIQESRFLGTDDSNKPLVYLKSQGCVWFFCQTIEQVQQINIMDDGYILSVTLPDKSDLEYGKVLWHIEARGEHTYIRYNADFIPDFWVPPLIGTWIMSNRLLEEGEKTLNGIEERASNILEDED